MKSEAVELKFKAKEINVSQEQWDFDKINGVDKEIKGSHLAVGRVPNTDMLQLENN
jgi:pyruvate/2-oxoglutarate dehydrogenase complex dihydrolipoamide dehydrogenase (E3) component